jgi:pyridoxamine 5'-phosphate oxidase
MDKTALANLRRDYSLKELSRTTVNADPFFQFTAWMNEALSSDIVDATAMTLSTVDGQNRPSSRVVLLKGFDARGLVFFTNYESKKGRDLAVNPHAALGFYWPELERQILVRGTGQKTTPEESQAYFATRPLESRLGAWASKQSDLLANRQELEARVAETRKRFEGQEIPCPPFWGGFRICPERFEFWQGRASRLHDRICYTIENGLWQIARLSP